MWSIEDTESFIPIRVGLVIKGLRLKEPIVFISLLVVSLSPSLIKQMLKSPVTTVFPEEIPGFLRTVSNESKNVFLSPPGLLYMPKIVTG